MAPFPGDRVGPGQQLAVDDDTAANPCPENHAEHAVRALPGPINCLGQRQAIGVVRQAHRTPERNLDILTQWPTIEARGVAAFHQAAGG